MITDMIVFADIFQMTRSFILPGQPTRYARDISYKIDHLKLQVEPDFEKKSISGKVLHRIRASSKAISSIELDAADLYIDSVKVNGRKAGFETRRESVKIDLGLTLEPDSTVEVEIEYRSTPNRGLYFRGPSKKYPNRFVHMFTHCEAEDSKFWLPCYDYPNMKFTSEVIAIVPAKMIAVSNGKLLSVKDSGGEEKKKVWHFSQEVPHSMYLLSLAVGEFEKISEVHDGISLEYYLSASRRQDADRSFAKTGKIIDFYGKVTGLKYP